MNHLSIVVAVVILLTAGCSNKYEQLKQDVDRQMAAKDSQINSLQSQQQQLVSDNRDLTKRVGVLETGLQGRLASQMKEELMLAKKHREQIQSSDAEANRVLRSIKQVSTVTLEELEVIKRFVRDASSLTAALEANQYIQHLMKNNDALRSSLTASTESMKALQAVSDKIAIQASNMKSSYDTYISSANTTLTNIQNASRSVQVFRNDLANFRQRIRNLRSRIEQVEKDINRVNNRIPNKLQKKLDNLSQNLNSLSSTVATLSTQVNNIPQGNGGNRRNNENVDNDNSQNDQGNQGNGNNRRNRNRDRRQNQGN